jgi:hypothetical protein
MVGWLLSKAAAKCAYFRKLGEFGEKRRHGKKIKMCFGVSHTTPFTGILDEQLLRDGCKNNLSIGFKAQNSGRPYMVKRPFLGSTGKS